MLYPATCALRAAELAATVFSPFHWIGLQEQMGACLHLVRCCLSMLSKLKPSLMFVVLASASSHGVYRVSRAWPSMT